MIIDGHAHALAEFSKPESISEIMEKLAVDKIVLCPGGGDENYEPMRPNLPNISLIYNPHLHLLSNRFLRFKSRGIKDRDTGNKLVYELTKKLPNKIIQFYWVNINDKNHLEKLKEYYDKWKFKGIKLHQCVIPFKIDSEEIVLISQFAAKNKLPIFIHLYSAKEVKKFVKLARKYSEVKFIIAHLMGLEQVIKNGSDLSNVYFDISTYYIINEKRIMKAIENFGIDHVLLGSDSPLGYDNLENNIKKIKGMGLTKSEKEKILGKNIAKLLEINE